MSKFPPSPSGIALYASVFRRVLEREGPVRVLSAPGDPRESQRLRSALAGLVAGLRTDLSTVDRVHVELSGRALFEFYLCVGLVLRLRHRPPLEITCHDSPAIVGPALLFSELDRRGFRRLGMLASRVIGSRLERRVLAAADRVWTLTEAGAGALSRAYGRRVEAMPHVVDVPERVIKQHAIFVPGPIGDPGGVIDALSSLAVPGWEVVLGLCGESVEARLRAALGTRFPLRFTGYLDERSLLDEFAKAAIVLRLRGGQDSGNSYAASGPLSWAVSRGCVCITDDDRAGALELAERGLVERALEPGAALQRATQRVTHETAEHIRMAAQHHLGVGAVASVRERARDSTGPTAASPPTLRGPEAQGHQREPE